MLVPILYTQFITSLLFTSGYFIIIIIRQTKNQRLQLRLQFIIAKVLGMFQ